MRCIYIRQRKPLGLAKGNLGLFREAQSDGFHAKFGVQCKEGMEG
ncbi:MAG: hypothetical protein RLZZ519_1007 [Bacteroidota bacterium]|jgi:hypothetical protein